MRKAASQIALRGVAAACVLVAGFGIYYTLMYFAVVHDLPPNAEEPYFRRAYLTMVAICLIWYAALLGFSMHFWKLKTAWRYWFLGVLVAEAVYFFAIGLLWTLEDQDIARSVAAATGVANGGLMAQAVSLFPIWAPIIVFWAHANRTPAPS